MSYSIYSKYDLHIHTDKSKITKENDYEGVFSLKKLLEQLKEKEVNVFSLTDHNIFNVNAYKALANLEDKSLKYFIGVEIDILKEDELFQGIAKSVKGQKTKGYHALLIFKSIDIDSLNMKLNEMYEKVQFDYNKSGINDKIDLFAGNIKNRYTSLDRIVTAFKCEDYLIISHGNKNKGIVETYKNNITEAQSMILLGFIDSLEMAPNKVNAIEHYNEGFDKILKDEYKDHDDVPYVVFSDNHNVDAYPYAKANEKKKGYNHPGTWIKGDTSFETLKLSFVDPKSRIKIQVERPEPKQEYLEELQYILNYNNGEKTEKNLVKINFSDSLNTIIGGRSSGKSLLFNAILHNLHSSKNKSDIKNYNSSEQTIIDIESIEGKLSYQKEMSKQNTIETVAYKQEEIVKLFENQGTLLSDHLPFKKYDEKEISNITVAFFDEVENLKSAYKNFYNSKEKYNLNILISDILTSKKQRMLKYDYKEGVQSVREKLKTKSVEIYEFNNKLNKIVESLTEICEFRIENEVVFNESEVSKINEVVLLLNKKQKQLKEIYKTKLMVETFIDNIEKEIPKYIEKIESDSDSRVTNSEKIINENISNINSYFNAKLTLRKTCESFKKINIKFEPLIEKVSSKFTLKTSINYIINYDVFLLELRNILNGSNEFELYDTVLKMAYDELKISRNNNLPITFDLKIERIKIDIKNRLLPVYEIIEHGKASDVNSKHMSPGKKASTFLEIKLDFDIKNSKRKIYLIDQPEDNIDNSFIAETLVKKIRDLKEKNQVILVTHNATLAINCDSENIIIANNDEGLISYQNSGLENVEHRKKVCKILDGGYYVFDNRYHKYDIPFKKLYEPLRSENTK